MMKLEKKLSLKIKIKFNANYLMQKQIMKLVLFTYVTGCPTKHDSW